MVAYCCDGVIDGEIIGRPKMAVPQADINMVIALCQNAQSMLGKDSSAFDAATVEAIFLFSAVWSLGGCVEGGERVRFDKVLKDVCGVACVPGCGPCAAGSIPADSTLFEYRFDTEVCQWKAWRDYVTGKSL